MLERMLSNVGGGLILTEADEECGRGCARISAEIVRQRGRSWRRPRHMFVDEESL